MRHHIQTPFIILLCCLLTPVRGFANYRANMAYSDPGEGVLLLILIAYPACLVAMALFNFFYPSRRRFVATMKLAAPIVLAGLALLPYSGTLAINLLLFVAGIAGVSIIRMKPADKRALKD